MRRFVTMSMLVSVVLLVGGICFAQDKQADAGGAKADSPDMWAAYKQMWEGEWEATLTMPIDLPGKIEIKKGEKFAGTMTDEVILDGHAMLITRVFRRVSDGLIVQQKGLAGWCPKQKAVLLHEFANMGERSESVIELVDGQEHLTGKDIDAEGNEFASHTQSTVVDRNTIKLKFLDGPFEGFEITWKRKKS